MADSMNVTQIHEQATTTPQLGVRLHESFFSDIRRWCQAVMFSRSYERQILSEAQKLANKLREAS